MSLVFNDTSGQSGLVQAYEDECGFDPGEVSGNATRLAKFVAAVNSSLDDFIAIAIQADGTFQFDDTNHEKYPIIKTDLVSGQRDYTFLTDEEGRSVLEILKVAVADQNGIFSELRPVDVEAPRRGSTFFDGQNATGTPLKVEKLGNSFFLDPIPSYNATGGLKAYVNREGSYFTVDDTTKKPGVPGIFHKYFYLKPALDHARRKGLDNYTKILREVVKMEGDPDQGLTGSIAAYFAQRDKGVSHRLTATWEDNR